MTDIILICTVGGSHEPILTAIRDAAPDFVCFICSQKDPATGRAGSDIQITGKGNIIKRHPCDDRPTLPNIPAQSGLRDDQYEVVLIPADDLDDAFIKVRNALKGLAGRFPQGRFLADYTGGTKTMTAALVTAALESDHVELQLVTGSRTDLIKVRSGMESAIPANVERIRVERAMLPYIAAWRRFAYAEAAKGLAALKGPRDPQLAAELRTLRDLSRAFDAWDRFDHAAALHILEHYATRIGQTSPQLLTTIKLLASQSPKQEPMRLFDLWRNAQRRAAQGRYDDAVARIYRLLEWIAQWLLRSQCALDTSDIPIERVPAGIEIPRNREGKRQAGLFCAWELLGHLAGGPAAEFVSANHKKLLDHLKVRNQSILAHGFAPVAQHSWDTLGTWFDEAVIPMLEKEAALAGVRFTPPQLPTEFIGASA